MHDSSPRRRVRKGQQTGCASSYRRPKPLTMKGIWHTERGPAEARVIRPGSPTHQAKGRGCCRHFTRFRRSCRWTRDETTRKEPSWEIDPVCWGARDHPHDEGRSNSGLRGAGSAGPSRSMDRHRPPYPREPHNRTTGMDHCPRWSIGDDTAHRPAGRIDPPASWSATAIQPLRRPPSTGDHRSRPDGRPGSVRAVLPLPAKRRRELALNAGRRWSPPR